MLFVVETLLALSWGLKHLLQVCAADMSVWGVRLVVVTAAATTEGHILLHAKKINI